MGTEDWEILECIFLALIVLGLGVTLFRLGVVMWNARKRDL